MNNSIVKTADLPDFTIHNYGPVSSAFLSREILTFHDALHFVRQLPYGRNPDKNNLTTVFKDACGTCSTKHALLKSLADEHQTDEVRLMVGIFKMNSVNTPRVSATLHQHQLAYLPEAHCYLKWHGEIIDVTKVNSSPGDFIQDLLEEVEIAADQISEFKVNYHRQYLTTWLSNVNLPLTLDALWKIREQCILDLFD